MQDNFARARTWPKAARPRARDDRVYCMQPHDVSLKFFPYTLPAKKDFLRDTAKEGFGKSHLLHIEEVWLEFGLCLDSDWRVSFLNCPFAVAI